MIFFIRSREKPAIETIKDELKEKMKEVAVHPLTKEEQGLLERIKSDTQEL